MLTPKWKTADRCGSSACVEVRADGDTVQVRDSKNAAGVLLLFTTDEWLAFLASAKDGEFDL